MKILAKKITGKALLEKACSYTVGGMVQVRNMQRFYESEHSPIRTQLFIIEMLDIPSFVSVHLVRHHVGVMHFVQSMREDRGADVVADRNTPVHHMMIANAQALIDMARKRLCYKSHKTTMQVMKLIQDAVRLEDEDLAAVMKPDCEYRKGCHEFSSCGHYERKQK